MPKYSRIVGMRNDVPPKSIVSANQPIKTKKMMSVVCFEVGMRAMRSATVYLGSPFEPDSAQVI